jgi:hypothetical protein
LALILAYEKLIASMGMREGNAYIINKWMSQLTRFVERYGVSLKNDSWIILI